MKTPTPPTTDTEQSVLLAMHYLDDLPPLREIAEVVGVTKQRISVITNSLLDKGLVEKIDRPTCNVRLSPTGTRLVAHILKKEIKA